MAHGGNRVFREHSRAGIAHDDPNALPLLWSVTMVLASIARRLVLHVAAAFGTRDCIGVDGCACRAYRLSAMGGLRSLVRIVIAGAIQGYHLRYSLFFALAPSSGFGTVLVFHALPFRIISGRIADVGSWLSRYRTVCAQNLKKWTNACSCLR